MNVTCDIWEMAFPNDPRTITIDFEFCPCGGGEQELITSAQTGLATNTVYINNDNDPAHLAFWLDPNPLVIQPWTNIFVLNNAVIISPMNGYIEETNDQSMLRGWSINAARWCQIPSGAYSDAFTVLLHEEGHALGLSYGNPSFITESIDTNLTIESGLYAGMVVPLKYNDDGIVSHIGQSCDTGLTLMSGEGPSGIRQLPSVLDMAVLSQLNGFKDPNWKLDPVLHIAGPNVIVTKSGHKTTTAVIAVLTWIQPLGGQYEVEQCTDLSQQNWSVICTNPPSTNGYYSYAYTMTIGSGNAFFRLEQVSPP